MRGRSKARRVSDVVQNGRRQKQIEIKFGIMRRNLVRQAAKSMTFSCNIAQVGVMHHLRGGPFVRVEIFGRPNLVFSFSARILDGAASRQLLEKFSTSSLVEARNREIDFIRFGFAHLLHGKLRLPR